MTTLGYSNTMTHLPETTLEQLIRFRETDTDLFYAKIRGLRENKWSLRKIANDLGVSPSGVAIWERKAAYASTEDLPIAPQRDPAASQKPKKIKVEITDSDRQRIAELSPKASEVRRFTPHNHPSRKAAEELEQILYSNKQRGVSLQDLAKAAGRTRRAIAQRLEKFDGITASNEDSSRDISS